MKEDKKKRWIPDLKESAHPTIKQTSRRNKMNLGSCAVLRTMRCSSRIRIIRISSDGSPLTAAFWFYLKKIWRKQNLIKKKHTHIKKKK